MPAVSGRRDKKAASRTYFGRHAAAYESGRRWRSVREPQAEALALLEPGPADRMLDVGCGTGAAVREAASRVERAVGLDLTPEMIQEAQRLAEGVPRAEFVIGDAESLPFAAGEFTAVLCTTSLHHHPRPERTIAEMARVLAPGGRAVIGDANRDRLDIRVLERLLGRFQPGHARILGSAELSRLLKEVGLAVVASRSLWHGGYMIFLARKPEA